jgi:hypothetical protein
MAGREFANILRQGARFLARKPPAQASYALAFSSKSGSRLQLMSGPAPNRQNLLIRCGGDEKVLEALAAKHDGNLKEVDSFLQDVEKGLIAFRIAPDGGIIMRITEKGAEHAAKHDAEIRKHSVY